MGARRVGLSAMMRRIGLAIGLALLSPSLLATTGSQSGNFEMRVLAAHNRERAGMGIAPMRWNEALARDAAIWGEHLARVGYLVHSSTDPRDPDPQGENLWAGTRGYYSLESMVGLWVAEKKNFRPGLFPANSRTGDLEDVGHYTQVVWRSSGEVGCALVRGRHDDFFVCRYAEGGNVIGEWPF
ncbi:CAP domain-containing protein [Sphingomonas quercus]|nr:CAP domain-containing protein [Sphingomonas quercus]